MKAAGGRCAWRSSGIACLMAWLSAMAAAADPPSLFDRDEILELTLEVPVRDLLRLRSQGGELGATLRWGDGVELPVRVSTYGKSRLRECRLPPLLLTLDPGTTEGTPFAGYPTLRLVTHCRRLPVFERCMLLEYLAYRTYAVIAEPAVRVRLARIGYRDSRGQAGTDTRNAFFVEDIGEVARRLGLSWASFAHQGPADLDPENASVYSLFQFMIGNTDWSNLTGPEGERCCHNTAVLEDPESGSRFLMPYDLDQAGLVDAPYATPSDKLRVSDVKDRVYRGFCRHNEVLPAVIERFNQRRDEIEALFRDDSLPDRRGRLDAWEYLTGFYEIINDPRKLESGIVRRCRRTGG